MCASGPYTQYRGKDKGITERSMISEVPSVDLYQRMLDESHKKAKGLEDKFASLMKERGVSDE